MKRIIKKIFKFVKWFQLENKIEFSDEVPEYVRKKTIYIIGDPHNPWALAFKCPCGCKDTITLNLLTDVSPSWSYKIHFGNKITISPSVWRTIGCKSHFFIRGSKIIWAKNYKRVFKH